MKNMYYALLMTLLYTAHTTPLNIETGREFSETMALKMAQEALAEAERLNVTVPPSGSLKEIVEEQKRGADNVTKMANEAINMAKTDLVGAKARKAEAINQKNNQMRIKAEKEIETAKKAIEIAKKALELIGVQTPIQEITL